MKAVENPNRRRAHHLSAGRRSERSGINSPMSQFPATPLTETGPSGSSIYSYQSDSTASVHPYLNGGGGTTTSGYHQPHSNGFDDELDELVYDHSESGRSTPSTMARRQGNNTRSLPVEQRGDPNDSTPRPRAQTEDSSSAVIHQWRTQTPGVNGGGQPAMPGLPRGPSHASQGSESHSLRSSASSRQLRSKLSSEWGGNGSTTTSPALGYSRLPMSGGASGGYQVNGDEETTPRQGGAGGGVPRQTSHGHVPTYGSQPPMLRNRSASSPNMYQGPTFASTASPQLPEHDWSSHSYASGNGSYHHQQQPQQQQQQQYHQYPVPPPKNSHKTGGTNSGGTLASASSASIKKRFSSSSNGTDRSSATSNQSLGQSYTAATSPATTLPGSLPPSGGLPALPGSRSSQPYHQQSSSHSNNPLPPTPTATAVRVKVTYGEDTFVVVVLSSVSYRELVEKVLKKIQLCGRGNVEASTLRLRYQDEDGDRILITSEEDVMMAFEAVRAMSPSQPPQGQTLVLFATVDSN